VTTAKGGDAEVQSGNFSKIVERKKLAVSRLHVSPLKFRRFWRKNLGPTENILRFFSRFFHFSRLFPLQAIALQRQAAIQALPKKSCQKTDGRFSVCPRMCHNRRMKVETKDRNDGCQGWTAIIRRPALPAQRFGARNDSSTFRHTAGIIGRISDHGFQGFHGWEPCLFFIR